MGVDAASIFFTLSSGSLVPQVTTRRVRRRLAKTFQRIIQRKKGVQLERFGAAEKLGSGRKLLKVLVGAWGFEPQTPTVSR